MSTHTSNVTLDSAVAPPVARLDRRARRAATMAAAATVAVSLSIAAAVVYQLRYDVDTRVYEVRVHEVRSGADGTATFRTCLPSGGDIRAIYTSGTYRVAFAATRPEATRVAACIRSRSNVAYAGPSHAPA